MAPEPGDSALSCPISSLDPDVNHGIFAKNIGVLGYMGIVSDSSRPLSLQMSPLGRLRRFKCQPVSTDNDYNSWPPTVARRWKTLNQPNLTTNWG